MASAIIPASKSLTITNKLPDGNINGDTITVGYDGTYNYNSYLFFDISPIPGNVNIKHAELVLFKTNDFCENDNKKFRIYQLTDYFSSYTTYNNHPEVNRAMVKEFCPMTSKVAVVINVTTFVLYWVKYGTSNTGIMLFGRNSNVVADFGSAICKDKYLVPFIKITYKLCSENNNCLQATTRQVRVTGTVAPESNYEAVVNVEVERSESGHKDNYYVADEYNNLSNNNPLYVDKTYNIAIIPKENTRDSETINFYGSYKE